MTGIAALVFLASVAGLGLATRQLSASVEERYPATGSFIMAGDVRLHYRDHPAGEQADLHPVVFLHGASSNLNDLEAPLAPLLKGRARLIFFDRPGHGWSSRQKEDGAMATPSGQAAAISQALRDLGVEKAVVVGHSLGGAVAAAFAVNHPDQLAGVVFLAPATHPWPGAAVTWYYPLTRMPVIGRLFSNFVAIPAGNLLYHSSVRKIFEPSRMPRDYEERSATRLVLRPGVFRNNAADVVNLYDAVLALAPRYGEIRVPVSILSDPLDTVVLHSIHSEGLKRDIAGAELTVIEGAGHMPAWTRPQEIIAEIVRVGRREM